MPHVGEQFLRDLWGADPPGRIQVWLKEAKASVYLLAPVGLPGVCGPQSTDAYTGIGLAARDLGRRHRATANQVSALAGLWCEVDVNGGPEQKKLAAPTKDAALEFIRRHGPEPTILVDSGYGIHAWWLFDEVWMLTADADRQAAANAARSWVALWQQRAKDEGWPKACDSIGDLARIMRIPGTLNGKGAKKAPVALLAREGPRYSREAIVALAADLAPQPVRLPESELVADVEIRSALPSSTLAKVEALRDNDAQFDATWKQERHDRAASGWSSSEYDLSLLSIAAYAGFTDQELADLLVAYRTKHGEKVEKATRPDYVRRTILRAKQKVQTEQADVERDAQLEELAAIAAAANGAGVDPDAVLNLFNAVIAGGRQDAPRIKEARRYRMRDQARYVLVTDQGRELSIGRGADMIDPRRFAIRLMEEDERGFTMRAGIKTAVWRDAVHALNLACEAINEEESDALEWVRQYVHDRALAFRDEACQGRYPFAENGEVHVHLDTLAQFIRHALRLQVTKAELKPLLVSAGFEPRKVHYSRADGVRTTVIYYAAAEGLLA